LSSGATVGDGVRARSGVQKAVGLGVGLGLGLAVSVEPMALADGVADADGDADACGDGLVVAVHAVAARAISATAARPNEPRLPPDHEPGPRST
jgi:hypothetical protein